MSTGAPAEGSGAAPPAPRFLADVMLERLARWLRAVGVDAASADRRAPDAALRRRASAEGRVLLTRDRRLAADCAAVGACLRVRAAAPLEQLAEVVEAFALAPPELRLTRCLVCNAELRPADAAAVFAPPLVAVPADRPLWRCPACGRVYWEGSHTRRMRAALAAASGRARRSGPGDPPRVPKPIATAARSGHAPCPPPGPARHEPTPEDAMSGSTNSSNPGTKAGRPAQNANHDVTARHGDDLERGVRHSDDTGASTSARTTESGEADTRRRDPDDPADPHANQREA